MKNAESRMKGHTGPGSKRYRTWDEKSPDLGVTILDLGHFVTATYKTSEFLEFVFRVLKQQQ